MKKYKASRDLTEEEQKEGERLKLERIAKK
jgi:hypothetical protein